MKILISGDIMPGGVLPYQDYYIAPKLLDYIRGFDFRIGTLESAIGTGIAYDEGKMSGRQNIVYARNEDLFRLKEMGFDVVSLANNHIGDLGELGILNTIKLCDDFNIRYLGAGINKEMASKPVIIEKGNEKVAILSYCMFGDGHWATIPVASETNAGINILEMSQVISDIRDAKKRYNYVMVLPHWGHEYTSVPTQEAIIQAKNMIESGADAVLGSHSHQVQPLIFYKGMPICFSMGNFLFPDFYMHPPRPIWYPDSDIDLSKIEESYSYPFPITKPMKRVWPSLSRLGLVLEAHTSHGRIHIKKKWIRLSASNVLESSYCPLRFRYQLWRIGTRCKYLINNQNKQ